MENQTVAGTQTRNQYKQDGRQKTGNASVEEKLSHKEGPVAEAIERETSKLPSDLFLWIGFGLLGASVFLHSARQKNAALVVGQFAAPILIMGLYNKTVKQAGHDFLDKNPL